MLKICGDSTEDDWTEESMPVQWPQWLIGLFGGAFVWFGFRAIRTREARVDAEFDDRHGAHAVGLGWLWVVLGAGLLASAFFDFPVLDQMAQFFMQHE